MAEKRNVRRVTSGRQAVIKHYNARSAWDLPEWAQDWLIKNGGWVALAFAIILAPAAALAFTLALHTLPLEFLGISATDSGIGWAGVSLIFEFVLAVLAVRPIFETRLKGWGFLIAAAAVDLGRGVLLQRPVGGAVFLLVVLYLYRQMRHVYK